MLAASLANLAACSVAWSGWGAPVLFASRSGSGPCGGTEPDWGGFCCCSTPSMGSALAGAARAASGPAGMTNALLGGGFWTSCCPCCCCWFWPEMTILQHRNPKFNLPRVDLMVLSLSSVSPWAPKVTLRRLVFGNLWTLNPARSSCLRPLESLSIGSILWSSKRPLSSIITVTKVSPDSPRYHALNVVPSGPTIFGTSDFTVSAVVRSPQLMTPWPPFSPKYRTTGGGGGSLDPPPTR